MKLYALHGSPYIFTKFDNNLIGTATKNYENEYASAQYGFFFTNDYEYAEGYTNGTGKVYACMIELNNPLYVDMSEYMNTDECLANFLQQAKDEGRDGVVFEDIREPGRAPSNEYVVFDAKQITILNTDDNQLAKVNEQLEKLLSS